MLNQTFLFPTVMSNFSHPSYSLEDRRPRKPIAVIVKPLQAAVNKHPDEEIGVKYRPLQPIPDYGSLHSVQSIKESAPVKVESEKTKRETSYPAEQNWTNPWSQALSRCIETSSGVINLQ